MFENGNVLHIAKYQFAFKKDTFIYFYRNVFEKNILNFTQKYNKNIEFLGKLNITEYQELIYCAYKSDYTSRGIKRKLEKHLATLF